MNECFLKFILYMPNSLFTPMNMYVHYRLNQKMVSKAEAQGRDTIKPHRGLEHNVFGRSYV